MHKVSLVQGSNLKCENSNYHTSFDSPCRYVIVCNQENTHISNFCIRYSKSYNCRAMDGLIERCFADYDLLSLKGSYDINDCKEISINKESSN